MLVFVFDDYFADQNVQHIKAPGLRASPFAEYLIKSGVGGDQVRTITMTELDSYVGRTEQDLLIYPVGVFLHFHHALPEALISPEPVNQTMRAKFASLAKVERLHLMLDLSWELATARHLETLPKLLALAGFPMHRLIFLASHSRLHLMSRLGYETGATILGTWFFEYYVHDLHAAKFAECRERARRKRSRSPDSLAACWAYLCLNRRMRPHRLMTASYLHRHGFLDAGLLSFGGAMVEPEIDRFNDQIVEETKLLVAGTALHGLLEPADIDRFLQLGPCTLDMSFTAPAMQRKSSAAYVASVISTNEAIDELYDQSLFSIVPETWYGEDNFDSFLTEKIFKPILNFHPFILLAAPGSLGDLRELGYRTFEPVFDERYDGICDPQRRFAATARTMAAAICGIRHTPDKMLPALWDTAQHNQENFISGTPTRAAAFVRRLEDEVRRSRCHVFSELITQKTLLAAAGDVQGVVVPFDGREYCRILASASPYVSLGEGFYDPERHGRGCWSGRHGTLTLRLDVGRWEIILASWSGTSDRAPEITANGWKLQAVWRRRDGRDHACLSVTLDKPVLTLRFAAPWARRPEGQARELGFWLFADILLGVAAAAAATLGPVDLAPPDPDRLGRSTECRSELGEAIEQLDDGTYLSIKPSTSRYVQFPRGFFAHEAVAGGRWCGPDGDMTLALTPGAWMLALPLQTASPLPWITCDNMQLEVTWVADPAGRRLARIKVTATESPVVLRLRSRNAFMPAEIDPQSTDRRILGFWLADRLLIRPESD